MRNMSKQRVPLFIKGDIILLVPHLHILCVALPGILRHYAIDLPVSSVGARSNAVAVRSSVGHPQRNL